MTDNTVQNVSQHSGLTVKVIMSAIAGDQHILFIMSVSSKERRDLHIPCYCSGGTPTIWLAEKSHAANGFPLKQGFIRQDTSTQSFWLSQIVIWLMRSLHPQKVEIDAPYYVSVNKTGTSPAVIYSLFPTSYTVFPSTYNICYPLSSTCFRPHRPIIRRSKLYMQPMVSSPSADVFVVGPLRKDSKSFLNGRTTKTSAEGKNTIGCMYNVDLLMMGLWGLKHVEERG